MILFRKLAERIKSILRVLLKRVLIILDIEGPQTLNDNAQENLVALAGTFPFWEKIAPEIVIKPLPEEAGMTLGEIIATRFYQRLSNVDDIWGDFHKIAKDPTYSSGHTLKVALPFYKALGATLQWLYGFARDSIQAVPNVAETLTSLNRKYDVWMVSTSYSFFVQAYCDLVGFDFAKTYCTFVPEFDEIPITDEEEKKLLAFMKEVAQMPVIKYDEKTGEVAKEHQVYYDRFTNFIWEDLYRMPVGELLRIIHPVGQAQKWEAVEEIQQETKFPKRKTVYVGDSQTDVKCVEGLQGEGLTVMFNGKGRVCHLSDIMYIGEDARAIEEIADFFTRRGRQGVINHYKPPRQARFGGLLATVTPENAKGLEEASVKKRKEFRGVTIGGLT